MLNANRVNGRKRHREKLLKNTEQPGKICWP